MISRLQFLLTLLPLLLVAAPASPTIETFTADTRGFGHVAVTARFEEDGSSWTTLATEDAAHARLLASKRLADLLGFGDLQRVPAGDLAGTVLTLEGAGNWLLGTAGAEVHEFFAPNAGQLIRIAAAARVVLQPVADRAYPRWLDCFDNAGPGIWVGGGGDQYVLPSDFEWLRDRKLAFCTLSPTESRLTGPGMVDTTIYDWHTAMAAQYDLAYRVLFFPSSHEWLWNRTPLPYVIPEAGRTVTAPWLQYLANTVANGFEPVPALDPFVLDLRRRLGERLQADPNFVGMHGCTEIPEAGVDLLAAAARTPGTESLWHAYLAGELGMDLATVGRLHRGDSGYYRAWTEVRVPLPSDFIGWNPDTCLDLRGTWQMHEDTGRAGEAAGWSDSARAPTDWVDGDCNDPMILVYTPQRTRDRNEQPDFWMRRTFSVAPGQRERLAYLHIARDVYHGNHTPLFSVWLNGRRLETLSQERGDFDQCFTIGDALRDGENSLVFNTHGTPVPGYCFLGAVPLRRYPYMSEAENRLWFDAVNFDAWLRVGKIESQLRASRSGDPDRPLKMMATINLLDLTTPLAEKYGAYQHDTGGAGGYWCPMTGARLARTYGLPWSCEQGGPPRDAAGFQGAITRYVMYGNDALDMVFGVGHYRDNPDVAAWFDEHLELIRCIGKMHLPLPAIGVLRSTRATRLGFDEPWNWDIARGALQAVGRNFAYLEVPGILDGTIDRFPVVIDDGTVLLTEEEVEGLIRYVRRGGIFVAQHHTGRHSPSQADAWPLERALGLSVTPKLITAENYHRWPLGRIVFGDRQELLPSLRGLELEGSGIAIDYLGREHTGAIGLASRSEGVTPVATWDDGTMAVAEVRRGRGRFVLLGTPFYLRMKDVNGVWVNDVRRNALLDEFLTALGVPRDSWTGNAETWAEIWRSKNGVFDLYPVARMASKGDETAPVSVKLRRTMPLTAVTEISAPGHPRVEVSYADGAFSLPVADYTLMESRVYLAPRADAGRAALDWFRAQASHWRALPPVPAIRQPTPMSLPDDLLPLADGWTLRVEGQPERTVSLGAFASLGLPEATLATFARSVEVPAAWQGRQIDLVFNAEHWFWGIVPKGRLTINGQEAPLKQPIVPMALPGFAVQVTEAAAGGKLTIELEIDGVTASALRKDQKGLTKPHGVTGLFYLQSTEPAVKTEPLSGPWQAASGFNRLEAVQPGDKVKCLYLETRFRLPKEWPGRRLFLAAPLHLGFLTINGQVLQTPAWMTRLDISGLVHADGRDNLLRWVPAARGVAAWNRPYTGTVPQLNLEWMP